MNLQSCSIDLKQIEEDLTDGRLLGWLFQGTVEAKLSKNKTQ